MLKYASITLKVTSLDPTNPKPLIDVGQNFERSNRPGAQLRGGREGSPGDAVECALSGILRGGGSIVPGGRGEDTPIPEDVLDTSRLAVCPERIPGQLLLHRVPLVRRE